MVASAEPQTPEQSKLEKARAYVEKLDRWIDKYGSDLLTGNRLRQMQHNIAEKWKAQCEIASIEGSDPPPMPAHLRKPEEIGARVDHLEKALLDLTRRVGDLVDQIADQPKRRSSAKPS